jgi:putative FmdB family regulatory protein
MPLHEYECQQCKRRIEKIQKFSDAPLTLCPHCGGPLEQLIHAPALSFKGGGWYADLYSSSKKASSGETKSDGGSSPSSSGDGSSGSTSKESAPANTPAPSSAPAAPASSTSSEKK